jgi:nucleotide-binding universal stress UspA family protein
VAVRLKGLRPLVANDDSLGAKAFDGRGREAAEVRGLVQKILVHLDASRPQRKARLLAADLARRLDAELLALYVVDEKALMGAEPVQAVEDAFAAIAEKSFSDLRSELGEDVEYEKIIGYGDTAKTVAHYVRKEGADLVISGGYHESIYERVPFGSLVNDIIHRVQASVFLIRDYHELPKEGGTIMQLFGADKGSVKTLYATSILAKALSSRIVATSLAPATRRGEFETMMMGTLQHSEKVEVPVAVDVEERAAFRPAWRAIGRAASRLDASMISVGRGYHASTLLGRASPIEGLVVHTKVPLYVHWDE